MSSYIPAEEDAALAWMTVFAAGLTNQGAVYMVSAADALAVTNAVSAFADALAITQDPATKTKVTVADKDLARLSAEQICRQFAMMIKENAGISDPDKIAIGVRPANNSREPIPAPDTSPLMNIIAATPGSMTLRYSDSMTPDTGRKPYGVISLQLFCHVGETPTVNEDDALFLNNYTKNPIGVGFDPADDGKIATFFSRWQTRRGDVGPWSLPVSMRIAA